MKVTDRENPESILGLQLGDQPTELLCDQASLGIPRAFPKLAHKSLANLFMLL